MSTTMTQLKHDSHSSEGEESAAGSLAERRALHNSVERTRREALNAKFTHLAQQLPSLSHIHRPSKSVIISHCLDMIVDLREAKAENEALRQEIHYLHSFIASQRQPSPQNAQQTTLLGHRERLRSLETSTSPPTLQHRPSLSARTPSPGNFTQHLMSDVAQMPMSYPRSSIAIEQGSINATAPVTWSNSMYSSMQQPIYPPINYADTASEYGLPCASESSASTRVSDGYNHLDQNGTSKYLHGAVQNSHETEAIATQYYRPDLYL